MVDSCEMQSVGDGHDSLVNQSLDPLCTQGRGVEEDDPIHPGKKRTLAGDMVMITPTGRPGKITTPFYKNGNSLMVVLKLNLQQGAFKRCYYTQALLTLEAQLGYEAEKGGELPHGKYRCHMCGNVYKAQAPGLDNLCPTCYIKVYGEEK